MGWTFTHRDKGTWTNKDWFQNQFNADKTKTLVLDAATVGGVCYMAVKSLIKGDTFAVICLLQWRPKEYHNFRYKDMDESMGPNEARCPERILKLLSPLPTLAPDVEERASELQQEKQRLMEANDGRWLDVDDELRRLDPNALARDWRRRCEKKASRVPLKPGMTVEFAQEITFTDGYKGKRFKTIRWGKRSLAFTGENHMIYKFDHRRRDYEVV